MESRHAPLSVRSARRTGRCGRRFRRQGPAPKRPAGRLGRQLTRLFGRRTRTV